MSLRDRPPKNLRPRWPAQFDIEGIPREAGIREQRKQELQFQEESVMPQNEFDLNRPQRVPYTHQEYPRMLYKSLQQLRVEDAAAEKKAAADGYTRTPDAKKVLVQRAKENKKALRRPTPADEEPDAGEVA